MTLLPYYNYTRGLSCGIHASISKEECYQIANKVRAAVAVVENHSLMCKFLMVRMYTEPQYKDTFSVCNKRPQ